MRMLIVEDEKDLCNILKKRLQKEYTIDICMDGEIAKDYLNTYTYDIILLDIMLPKIDGITLLKWLRNQKKTTPVLLLTAKSSIEERVNGLDSGADDYLIKPFAFEELQARLRVLLRRNIAADPSDILIYEDLVMDTKKKKVSRNGKEISLTTKEYKLLQYMMRNPGHVLSRDQLEQRGWDSTFEGGSNIIDVYIRYLRKKIDSDYEKKLNHTVYGKGYCLGE